ncbi:MAG: hypothetical protein AB7V13_21135 [Pseudorhodoplanes sp.]|uniref:hypothetical protein n=1 Tax=Pseudorhodoplanes sp. TaxID=1934341 RepID=UPI003D13A063
MTDATQDELFHLVLARETVRMQAEILKATGMPLPTIATEMMVQAIMMVIPLGVDETRSMVLGMWETFLADYKARTAPAAALGGGVLPFARRPAANAGPE